jgi:hypothetical protein
VGEKTNPPGASAPGGRDSVEKQTCSYRPGSGVGVVVKLERMTFTSLAIIHRAHGVAIAGTTRSRDQCPLPKNVLIES